MKMQGRNKCNLLFAEIGFTLLEIMISLAIIGGLLVTLLYSLNYNLGIAGRHEFATIASLLARNKILDVEKNPIASAGEFPEPYSGYHYSAEVKESAYPGISELSVTVSKGTDEVKFSELTEKKR